MKLKVKHLFLAGMLLFLSANVLNTAYAGYVTRSVSYGNYEAPQNNVQTNDNEQNSSSSNYQTTTFQRYNRNSSSNYTPYVKSNIKVNSSSNIQKTSKKYTPTGKVNVQVNSPIPLSYKSKQEIYDIRKAAVNRSIFKNSAYEPSQEVFGQIEDGKPWVSYSCDDDPYSKDVSGMSEEARFIMNPTALIMLENPFQQYSLVKGGYVYHDMLNKIEYDYDKKEIIVTYNFLNFHSAKDNTFYQFNGINANDLGYKYIFVDTNRSSYKLDFIDKNTNVGNSVATLQNFLHTGGSCGVPGGCNNGSPRQPMLEFEHDNGIGEIYIKLWKKKPNSTYDTPDMIERIKIGV